MKNRLLDLLNIGPTVEAITGQMSAIKAAYNAALPSRFRRQRNRLGGTADAHYSNETEYWNVREYVRDMDRNDAIIGQLVDRAVDNIVGRGFNPIPQTGDKFLDGEIKARWEEWATDPYMCDVTERCTFRGMERLALRHVFVDGDVFALPTDDGALQLLEGDWVTSPSNDRDGVIHGVQIDAIGRPTNYWIVRPRPKEREVTQHRIFYSADAYDIRPARSADGSPRVLHVYNPKRITQTRGMTAFAPVFDIAGMFEDANFAKLVQQQISSCVAMFIERTSDFQLGSRSTETLDDSTTGTIEGIEPGIIIRGKPGEKMTAFAPNVTPSEWFDHVKLMLRMIGANLGMPLTLVLLDTTNTTFHGYRGELNQAQIGFRCAQDFLEERFHRPIYRWKVREWFGEKFVQGTASRGINLIRHRWARPGWPYIDPVTDIKADAMALENLLVSPRDLHSQRGGDWEDTVRETVEDRALSMRLAIEQAQAIEAETGEAIDWRDLLNLKTPSGVNVSKTPDQPSSQSAGGAE